MTTYETYPRKIRALTFFTLMDEGVSGNLVGPGDVIRITPNIFENTRGTDDNSWLTLTPAEQIAKWGQQRFEIVEA